MKNNWRNIILTAAVSVAITTGLVLSIPVTNSVVALLTGMGVGGTVTTFALWRGWIFEEVE